MADQLLDTFVIEMGRASKRALKLLRGLNAADRDDVLGTALMYAWEDRENATGDLDAWFREHLRAARSELHSSRGGAGRLEAMGNDDDAEREAALAQLTDRITAAVDAADQPLLEMYAQGYTCAEIASSIQATPTFVRRRLRTVRSRLGPLRKWLPDLPRITEQASAPIAPPDDAEPPPIDHAIEKMLRRPKTPRADCPVCWRCCWYDGLAPHKHLVLQSAVDKRKRMIALDGEADERSI